MWRWLRGLRAILATLRPPNMRVEMRALFSVMTEFDRERLERTGVNQAPARRWYHEPEQLSDAELTSLESRVRALIAERRA